MNQEPQEIFNVEAEQQILGAILASNDHLDKITDVLTPEHFFDPVHRRIFERCVKGITDGNLVSPVTLRHEVEEDPGLKELGGPAYLVRLQGASISAFAVRDYAMTVIDAWRRREMVATARETIRRLHEGADTDDVRNDVEGAMMNLQAVGDGKAFHSMQSSVTKAVDNIVGAYREGKDPGISTGYMSLDNILGGLAGGDMLTLAGTTSMGKTTVGLAIADKVAERGEGVAVISLEMLDDSLASRLLSSASKVPYQSMRQASQLTETQVKDIVTNSVGVAEKPIYIIPPAIREVAAIHGAVRAVKAECMRRGIKLSLVLVDYLQLVVAPGTSRTEQVSNASRSIKALATRLNVPVIALAQLSREIGKRDDKRPNLADIKDSSQIEQDSDQVVFCHREEYWLERDKPKSSASSERGAAEWADYEASMTECKGLVELIVAKNRHGRIDTAKLTLDPTTNTLTERFGADPSIF